MQEARDNSNRVLGERRLAESVRRTDMGRDVAEARLKEQTRRAVESGQRAERFGKERLSQGAERVGQGERRTQIAEARARKQGFLGESVGSAPPRAPVNVPSVSQEEIVLKVRQQMGTTAGREKVRELLAQMSPAEAAQIKALLSRGVAQMATTASGGTVSGFSGKNKNARLGEELARMLGQIE